MVFVEEVVNLQQTPIHKEYPYKHHECEYPRKKGGTTTTIINTHHNRPAECHRVSELFNIVIPLCTSFISLFGSVINPFCFPPQILNNNTMLAVNTANCKGRYTQSNLLCKTSTTWIHDLAALVHMAKEGKERGEGLDGEGMKGRWMRIWMW
jgi:hypothetical protein